MRSLDIRGKKKVWMRPDWMRLRRVSI